MHFRDELNRWMKRLSLRSAAQRTAARKPSRRLQVEPLEERATPTANITGLTALTDTGRLDSDGITKNATPTLVGTATAGASVQVFDGATALGATTADNQGNWTLAIPTADSLAEGAHDLKATDAQGTGTHFTVVIDTTAPIGHVPSLGEASDSGTLGDNRTNKTKPTLTGSAQANSTVEVFDGTASLGTATANADGVWSLTPATSLAEGSHRLSVKEADLAGNTSAASAALRLFVDLTPPDALADPMLDLGSDTGTPGDNQTEDATPTITGTAEANGTVEVFDGMTSLGTAPVDANGAWSFTPAVPLGNGSHTLTARATDAASNSSAVASAGLTLTINDTTAPSAPTGLTLHPASDSGTPGDNRTNDHTPTITGTAEANATVEAFEGTTSLGTATANASGVWSLTLNTVLAEGSHSLTAKAKDAAGNTSAASMTLTVTIDTVAPATPGLPNLVAGADTGLRDDDSITARTTPTFTGTAEPGSTVRILDGSRLLGAAVADAAGVWTFISPPLADGSHVILVTATDAAGNLSTVSAGRPITIDSTGRLANPLADVTARVRVSVSKPQRVRPSRRSRSGRRRGRARRPGSQFRRVVTITNTTGRAIEGPLVLALDNLNPQVRLRGSSARRSPFVQAMPANGSLAAGQSVAVVLTFSNPLEQSLRFTPRVMSGFGTP